MDTQNLKELFENKIFRIPDFQRGYAWGDRQLNDLWDDIIDIRKDELSGDFFKHYTGTIFIEQIPSERIPENELERDIDLLLMEEWCVNPDFAKFFLKNISSADFDIADRSAWHSITDDAYGESDIVLTFRSGGQSIAVLVEDKIDAAPQPDQAKRYQFRADKMKSSGRFDQIYICIVAPEHYLETDTEEYHNRISYETLADFLADGSPRGEYKANMLRLGISQERRHRKPVKNELVTSFWQNYHDALKTRFADAVMPYPKLVPINSDWPMIRFPEFPRKTHIVHKMAQGNLDLETGLSESRLREILSRWNTEGIMVVQTGKSFVLRIPVSPLNRLEDFSLQAEKVQKALDGIQTFRNCLKEYDLMSDAGRR